MIDRIAKTQANKPGFTLIELLVVIMLIGIMASFVLVALAGATATAKEDRTRAQIAKIHELIMTQWEDYQYRRIPPTKTMQQAMQLQGGSKLMTSKDMALHRLYALRELMRMELPTYMSDVTSPAKWMAGSVGSTPYQPAKWRAYRQRATAEWSTANEQAECLYLILSQLRDADASALEFFSENEIGDTDGDGMKEILDAWGNPIVWMLWAPGYLSPLQVPLAEKLEQHDLFDLSQVGSGYNAQNFDETYEVTMGDGQKVAVDERRLPRTLYPLVYSLGADGKSGIIARTDTSSWPLVENDPYNRDQQYKMFLLGATSVVQPEAGADDISNHYLTVTR